LASVKRVPTLILFLAMSTLLEGRALADRSQATVTLPGVTVGQSSEDSSERGAGLAAEKEASGGSVSIGHELAIEAPLLLQLPSAQGELSVMRGSGRRADEVQVSLLEVSLVPRFGGGLNLSTLPPYLFAGYRYQEGFGSSIVDSRGIGDSLQLSLWSAQDSARTSSDVGMGVAFTDQPVSSVWAGYRSQEIESGGVGIRAGLGSGVQAFSLDGVSDPFQAAGSVSAVREWSPGLRSEFHWIASHLRSEPRGTLSFRTPDASQLDDRSLMIVRNTWGGDAEFSTTHWLDFILNLYDDPSFGGSRSRSWWTGHRADLTLPSGFEAGMQWDGVTYLSSLFEGDREQGFLSGTAAYLWDGYLGQHRLQFDPMIRTDGLFRPNANWRMQIGQGWSVDAGVRHQFPSLLDMFAEGPFAIPNPGLAPEQSWQLGVAYGRPIGQRVKMHWFARADYRRQTFQSRLVNFQSQVVNSGDAYIGQLGNRWNVLLPLGFEIEPQWKLGFGELEDGTPVQGLARFQGGAKIGWRGKNFTVDWSNWWVSNRPTVAPFTLEPYLLGAIGVEGIFEYWRVRSQITNIYNQEIQFAYDQIPVGLQWSLTVSRSLAI
jgi:hypothetical protein